MFIASRNANTLKLTTLLFQSTAENPSNSICTASFLTTGDIGGSLVGTHADEYIDNQAAGRGGIYEVNYSSVTGDTGDLTGDAVDTWHPLTSQVDYILSATGVSSKTVDGTCTIREILRPSNSVTADMQLFAEITFP